MNNDIRWKQRFQNFEKAYNTLNRALDRYEKESDDEMIQMALVQAFEILLELSWKTIKDYLENEGTKVTSPKQVIRQAFQFEIITNGEDWMEALEQRNLTTHTYDEKTCAKVLNFIVEKFYPIARNLYFDLKKEL